MFQLGFLLVLIVVFTLVTTSCTPPKTMPHASLPPTPRSQVEIAREKTEVEDRIAHARREWLKRKEIEARVTRELEDEPKRAMRTSPQSSPKNRTGPEFEYLLSSGPAWEEIEEILNKQGTSIGAVESESLKSLISNSIGSSLVNVTGAAITIQTSKTSQNGTVYQSIHIPKLWFYRDKEFIYFPKANIDGQSFGEICYFKERVYASQKDIQLLRNLAIERHISELKKGGLLFIVKAVTVAPLIDIGPDAVEPLITLLKYTNNHVTSAGAAYGLGEIGDPRAIEPLIESLKTENKFLRGGAATALGKLKAQEAKESLKELLNDGVDFVREDATKALKKIDDM